jgi:hypothetical protein
VWCCLPDFADETGASSGIGFGDDTKEIATGVLEHDKVCAGRVSPRVANRTEAQQTLDLTLLLRSVEIEVNPAAAAGPMVAGLE